MNALEKMMAKVLAPPKRGTLRRVYHDAFHCAMRGAPRRLSQQEYGVYHDAIEAAWTADDLAQIVAAREMLTAATKPHADWREAAQEKAWSAMERAAKKRIASKKRR